MKAVCVTYTEVKTLDGFEVKLFLSETKIEGALAFMVTTTDGRCYRGAVDVADLERKVRECNG